jgi:hypothetical protein
MSRNQDGRRSPYLRESSARVISDEPKDHPL